MKKFILTIFCILLSNICFAQTSNGYISNRRGLIMQALDNSDCRSGQFVYFNFNNDFVDNQRFTVSKNYYLYANGVYKYINRENQTKTVRKIELYSKY